MYKILVLLFFSLSLGIQARDNQHSDVPEQGYLNFTSFGFLIGSGSDEETFIHTIQMDHNYRFNKHFAFGLSTGISWLDTKTAFIGPDLKIMLPQKNHSWYVNASIGRSITLKEKKIEYVEITDTWGKKYFNTELGYILPSKRKITLYTAIGYRYQEIAYSINDWWLQEIERTTTYNRFLVKIGIKLF